MPALTDQNHNRQHWEQPFTGIVSDYYQSNGYFTKDEYVNMDITIKEGG